MKRILILLLSCICLLSYAQEFKVSSLHINQEDLTARTESRVDGNGVKCALLRIYCADDITKAEGNVVGEVIKNGMEKKIYVAHDTKKIRLLFANHFPLMITFDDYGVPRVSEQMVYEVKLAEVINQPPSASSAVQTSPKTSQTPAISNTRSDEEILKEAMECGQNNDYAKALQLYMSIPDNKVAQFNIGVMYSQGWGVPKNPQEGINWYRKAAEQGLATAQFNLGAIYEKGKIVTPDLDEALKWYRKAAEQDMVYAQANLANMYRKGRGVTKDYKEAYKWYQKAAMRDDTMSQYYMGVYNQFGWGGIQVDYTTAAKWFSLAAAKGDADSQAHLGLLYLDGNGVPQDYQQALKYFSLSANQGQPIAQNAIGMMYEDGVGVPKNLNTAIEWYQKAASQGFDAAIDNLKRLGIRTNN